MKNLVDVYNGMYDCVVNFQGSIAKIMLNCKEIDKGTEDTGYSVDFWVDNRYYTATMMKIFDEYNFTVLRHDDDNVYRPVFMEHNVTRSLSCFCSLLSRFTIQLLKKKESVISC